MPYEVAIRITTEDDLSGLNLSAIGAQSVQRALAALWPFESVAVACHRLVEIERLVAAEDERIGYSGLMNLIEAVDRLEKTRSTKNERIVWRLAFLCALKIRPGLRDKLAKIRLFEMCRALKKKPYELLWTNYFPDALIHVIKDRDTRQRIRLGCKWIKSSRGRVVPKKPGNLSRLDFVGWVHKEVYNYTEASLGALADAAVVTKVADLERYSEITKKPHDDIDRLIDAEDREINRQKNRETIMLIEDKLTETERKIFGLARLKYPNSAIAAKLKITSPTVRVHRHHIRRKLAAISSR